MQERKIASRINSAIFVWTMLEPETDLEEAEEEPIMFVHNLMYQTENSLYVSLFTMSDT